MTHQGRSEMPAQAHGPTEGVFVAPRPTSDPAIAMPVSALDGLTGLDFAPTCQCHICHCTQLATRIVETHAVNHCDDDGLGPFGNTVRILCDGCLTRLRAHVAAQLARLARLPGRSMCGTCGAPVVDVGDVVRAEGRL